MFKSYSCYGNVFSSGGTEQRRRGDNNVKCPVCITPWDHVTSLLSSIVRPLDEHNIASAVTPTHNQLVASV